jgi:hypothetical protein
MVRSRQITAKLLFKTLKLFSVFFVSEMNGIKNPKAGNDTVCDFAFLILIS